VHAFDLGTPASHRDKNFMSHDWRSYVMGIDQGTRLDKVKTLLKESTNPTIQELSASSTALKLLTGNSPRIKTDGDKAAHGRFINQTRCSGAIGRCKSNTERDALNLFLILVVNYKCQ